MADFEKFDLTKNVPITYGNSTGFAAQAGDEPMRKDFEAWAWQECWTRAEIIETRTAEGYSLLSLNDAWSVWKAATLAAQVSPRATADVERESIAKLREMLQFALTQNECDMVLTGEECRKVSALLATTKPGA